MFLTFWGSSKITFEGMIVEKAISRFSAEISMALSLGIRMEVVVIKLALVTDFQTIPSSSIHSSIITGMMDIISVCTCHKRIFFPRMRTSSSPKTLKVVS